MRTEYLALLIVALFVGLLGLVVSSAFPTYAWISYACYGVAALLAGGWALLEKEELLATAVAPKARYGASSALSIVIAILVCVGLAVLTSRPTFNKSYDVSKAGTNTLAEQSIHLVKQIKSSGEKVKVAAIFRNEESKASFNKLLDLYARSADIFEVRQIDPIKDPMVISSLNVTAENTVIFNYGPREHRITTFTEERITNALISIFKEGSKKIYFTTGHGEPELEKGGAENFDIVIQELKSNKYEIETLALSETKTVPNDADLVVIAGPQYEFKSEEIEALRSYLEKGGSLLAMVDAMVPVEQLNILTKEYGMSFQEDWLILHGNDPRSMLFGQDNASINKFDEYHPLTREFARKGNVEMLFPRSRSIKIEDSNPKQAQTSTVGETAPSTLRVKGVQTRNDTAEIKNEQIESGSRNTVLAVSTLKVEAKNDLADNESASSEVKDVAADKLQTEGKEARLVLVGGAQFANNMNAQRLENRDFFSFISGFLLADEGLLTIKPREIERGRLDVSSPVASFMKALLAFIYPLCFLALGVFFWLTRRTA
jgi:ABC-type uncharacterized transport system involved in gliding motility auxiliary subunit